MARKPNDVELIITAKNESEKAFKSVADAMKEIEAAAKKGGGLSSLFEGFEARLAAVSTKQRQFNTLIGDTKSIQKSINAAQKFTETVKAQEAALAGAQKELSDLEANYAAVEQAANAARVPSEKLSKSLGEQQAKQVTLAQAIATTRAEIERSTDALNRNVGLDAKATAAVDKQRSIVVEAGKAWRATTQAVADARKQITALASQRDNVQAALTTGSANKSALQDELKNLKEFIKESARLSRTQGIGDGTKALTASAKARVAEVESLLKAERATQAALANDLSKTNAAIRRQEQAITSLSAKAGGQKKIYDDLKNSLKSFEASAKGEGAARQQAEIVKLNDSLGRLQATYDTTTAKVNATNAALAKSSGPDPKSIAQFQALKVKIDAARLSVQREEAELQKLTTQLNEAGVSTSALAARQRELDAVTERLTAEESRLNAVLRELGSQATSTSNAIHRAGAGFLTLGENTRQSLSYLQRIRGEFLSIIATTTGLYAIGGAIKSIYDATALLNKAESRFGIVFKGDYEKVAAEIAFVRDESERLGVSFETSLDQYSKFASGLGEGAVSLENMRRIFTGFATASRVSGTSAEEMGRVFNALTQIFGKQQLMMEELKGQLADALPGAIEVTAKALGMPINKLTEAVEAGRVGADAAILIANELQKKYGSELAKALNSPVAQMELFKNAVTDLKIELGKSGFMDVLIAGLKEATAAINTPEFRKGAKELVDGLAQIGKALLYVISNFEDFVTVLKLIATFLVAKQIIAWSSSIYTAGTAVTAWTTSIVGATGAVRLLGVAVGGLLRFLGLIPATAAAAFAFGTWLNKSFAPVQKFGTMMVGVMEYVRINVQSIWKKITTTLSSSFSTMLKQFGVAVFNFYVDTMKRFATLFASDALTKKIAAQFEKLKLDVPTDLEVSFAGIDADTTKQLTESKELIDSILADIDRNQGKSLVDGDATVKELQKINTAQQLLTEEQIAEERKRSVREGTDKKGEAAAKRLATLRQTIGDELAKIDAEIQEKSGDTLQVRLDSIMAQYQKLLRQIEQAGGEKQFPNAKGSIDQLVAIKQVEETEKEINKLIEERRTAISEVNELQSLGSITVEQANTRIADTNARILPQMNEALAKAREIAATVNSKPVDQNVANLGKTVDLEEQRAANQRILDLEKQINDQMALRAQRIQTVNALMEAGTYSEYEGKKKIAEINQLTQEQTRQQIADLEAMILANDKLSASVFGQGMLENLKQYRAELSKTTVEIVNAADLNTQFASGATDAFQSFIDGTMSAKDAFRSFVADFLKQIARAIIQQLIFNAISGAGGGGGLGGAIAGAVNHTGGVVGMTGSRRKVPLTAFAGAVRYHSGGIAGLKSDEVPSILQKGEEVITRNDPRHQLNGGGGQGGLQVKIVNAIDSASVLAEALNSAAGQKTLVNAIRANKSSVRTVLS